MRRILSLYALFLFSVAFCAQPLVDGTQLRQMVEKEGARLKGLQEKVEKLRGERRVLAEQMEARIHEVNDRIQALHGVQESIEEEFQEARSRRNSIISETDRSRRMLNDFAERNCLEVPPEEAVAAADARIQSQRLAEHKDDQAKPCKNSDWNHNGAALAEVFPEGLAYAGAFTESLATEDIHRDIHGVRGPLEDKAPD